MDRGLTAEPLSPGIHFEGEQLKVVLRKSVHGRTDNGVQRSELPAVPWLLSNDVFALTSAADGYDSPRPPLG
jgi:hypothetical protein